MMLILLRHEGVSYSLMFLVSFLLLCSYLTQKAIGL